MLVDIKGIQLNTGCIVSAEIDTRHYMNGSTSYLVVKLIDGHTIREEHGFGFDAFKTLEKIKEAMNVS